LDISGPCWICWSYRSFFFDIVSPLSWHVAIIASDISVEVYAAAALDHQSLLTNFRWMGSLCLALLFSSMRL
jgi:hypothetical protein